MNRLSAFVVALTLVAPAAAAEDKFDPEALAKAVAPFLDDQTFAIGHADLSRVDFDKTLALVKELGKFEDKEIEEPATQGKEWLTSFRKAGGKDVFVVVSMADVPNNVPFFVVPMSEKADEEALAKLFAPDPRMKYLVIKKALIVGNEKTIDRLQDGKPTPRPEVAKAFAAAGDTDAQFVLVPTDDSRKVVEQTYPELPKEIGAGATKVYTRGVQWLAIGVNGTPKPSAKLVVQSPDADSAKELHRAVTDVFTVLAKMPADSEVRKNIPNLEAVVKTFMPNLKDDRLTVEVDDKTLTTVIQPALVKVRESASRIQSSNNLKQLVIAMHSYHDTHGRFPAAYTTDKDGKPLLSWRVHILPYIEQEALYKEFHLDEPWDSEHNKKLIPKMPRTYLSSRKLPEAGLTTYLAPVGDATVFPGKDAIKITDITDGTSNTVMFLDADDEHAVIWTKPDDLKVDPKKPEAGLSTRHGEGYLFAFADGSVRFVSTKIEKKSLGLIFARNSGMVKDIP
jgi:hypothetical protein